MKELLGDRMKELSELENIDEQAQSNMFSDDDPWNTRKQEISN